MQNSNFPSGKISIIIVNYRSDQHLVKCIASLYNFEKKIPYKIIVVNNDEEFKIEEIKNLFPQVEIIQARENLGFGKAVNLGAKKAQGEILWFLNPDTKIKKELFPDVLAEFAKKPKVAMISPRLCKVGGETQEWTYGKKLTLCRLILNNLGFRLEKNKQTKKFVDWVSGAGIFIRKDDFLAVGGFDEKFFMYFEDLDLCLRVKKQNKKILYFPVVELLHVGSGSVLEDKERKKIYFTSQDYFFQKHYGKFQARIVKVLRKIFM